MGHLKIIRCTNADRVAYGGLEAGRMALETDTDDVYIGTAGGDVKVNAVAGETTYWNPDALPDTPSDQDDHFKTGALDGKWTEWDLGVPAIAVSVADTFLKITHTSEGTLSHRGVYQTLPAGDFTIVCKASMIGVVSANDVCAGLCLFQDATAAAGDIIFIKELFRSAATQYRQLWCMRYSDFDTWSANYAGGFIYPNTTCYLRIRRNGTTLYYEYGSDGISWQRLFSGAQPFAPAHMGLITCNNSGTIAYIYFDLFRYIASDQIGPIGELE